MVLPEFYVYFARKWPFWKILGGCSPPPPPPRMPMSITPVNVSEKNKLWVGYPLLFQWKMYLIYHCGLILKDIYRLNQFNNFRRVWDQFSSRRRVSTRWHPIETSSSTPVVAPATVTSYSAVELDTPTSKMHPGSTMHHDITQKGRKKPHATSSTERGGGGGVYSQSNTTCHLWIFKGGGGKPGSGATERGRVVFPSHGREIFFLKIRVSKWHFIHIEHWMSISRGKLCMYVVA